MFKKVVTVGTIGATYVGVGACLTIGAALGELGVSATKAVAKKIRKVKK